MCPLYSKLLRTNFSSLFVPEILICTSIQLKYFSYTPQSRDFTLLEYVSLEILHGLRDIGVDFKNFITSPCLNKIFQYEC